MHTFARLILLPFQPFIGSLRLIRWVYRRCSVIALLAGLAVGSAAVVGASIYAAAMPLSMRGDRETLLWAATLTGLVIAGGVMGYLARRVVLLESLLLVLVLGSLIAVHLQLGWHLLAEQTVASVVEASPTDGVVHQWSTAVLELVRQGEEEIYLQFVARVPLGVRIFGKMWTRFLGLAMVGGFCVSLLGSSFAFLLFGDEQRFDGRFGYEWRVARQYLRGSNALLGSTAFVAIAGVALGVAALVAVTAVMSGYQQDVQDKILSTNAHLVVQKYGIDFTEYQEVADQGLTVPGVLASTPFAFNTAMLSADDIGLGVLLKGIVPQTAGDVTAVNYNVCQTPVPDGPCIHASVRDDDEATAGLVHGVRRGKDGFPRLLLGHSLFQRLGLSIGEEVVLTTAVGIAGAHGNAPKRMRFKIGGSFKSGMHEFDSRLVYLHLSAAQELMGLGQAVNGLEFRVATPDHVSNIAREVLSVVGRYPYRTLDWHDLNSPIFTALKLQKIVMFLVLCFIVVVAAFNIASTLFMAAVEKASEIGVLKSMGASDASVMKIFVLVGWAVGGIGTLLGVLLGMLVCFGLSRLELSIAGDVYMVSSLQVQVDSLEVFATIAAALAISHMATLYPALAAARRQPVDAMR